MVGGNGEKGYILGAIVILWVLIFSAYSNTFQSPPVLDDFHSFVRNPSIYVEKWSWNAASSLSKTFFGKSRWIPMLTFALDYSIGKGRFSQFHLTNLIIHMLATVSVFFLALQCASTLNIPWSGMGTYAAVWVTALWALNPVQTSAVTYMVQRMASIQALFFTTSVAFYLKGRRLQILGTSRLRAGLDYLLCIIAALGAFLSKENSAMLPVMIIVAEIWFFQPDGLSRLWRYLKERSWSVWILIIAIVVVGVVFGYREFQGILRGYSIRHFTMGQRLLTESRVVVWYMTLLLLPFPSRLCLEHDFPISTSLISPPTTLLAIAFLACCVYLIAKYRRSYPVITFGGAWFFLNLVIESSIVPLELVFEHRLYLPSIGFCLALVFLFVRFLVKIEKGFPSRDLLRFCWSAVAIICAVFSLMTFERNQAWRDILTINEDAVRKNPRLPRAHANYAAALLRARRYQEAIAEGYKAIELGRPNLEDYVVAANAIVGAYMEQENWREAAEKGDRLLSERPENSNAMALPQLLLRVAESHRRLGELEEAYKYTVMALDVMDQLPFFFQSVKQFAVSELEQILEETSNNVDLDHDGEVDPGSEPVDLWVAEFFLKRKDYKEARNLLVASLEDKGAGRRAGDLLLALDREVAENKRQQKRWDFFVKYVRKPYTPFNLCMTVAFLVREYRLPAPFKDLGLWFLDLAELLNHDDPDVYLLRGWYYFEDNLVDKAIKEVHHAISLDPSYAKPWLAMGFFLQKDGMKKEASSAFKRFLELYPGYPRRKVVLRIMRDLSAHPRT